MPARTPDSRGDLLSWLQVAKALLDTAAKHLPKPQAPSLQGASFADPSTITSLLRFQEVRFPPLLYLAFGVCNHPRML